MGFRTEGTDKSLDGADVWEDADRFLSPTDLLDKALQHVRCPKPASILARQCQHGGGVQETVFKHLKRR